MNKVYNYLENHLLPLVPRRELLVKMIKLFPEIEVVGLTKFYSQSFKPEMITELFEGWENKSLSDTTFGYAWDFRFINTLKTIRINQDYKHKPIGINIYSEISLQYPYPETLNDFIRDCQRAGIELQWRIK